MIKLSNLKDIQTLTNHTVRQAIQKRAADCYAGDTELQMEMEEEFNGPLGGDWFLLEEGDDPEHCHFDGPVNLLGEEWNWCDMAVLENGCFFVFWANNNAGGPCLFVPDEPWVPARLRARLYELIDRMEP